MHLPPSFIQSLQNAPGFDEASFIQTHQSGKQIVSIRINPFKILHTSQVSPAGVGLEGAVPWSSHGYYLSSRPSFTLDPLFHAGAYYVQEASSMFLEEAIKQSCDISKPLKVLDLCAAPGGKSTLIQSIITADSLLVSNELIKTRVNILAENITKWGAANVVVTNNDPVHFKRLPNFFDLIVVDAPCSGSGLFRKDPQAIEEWSLNNVALCSQRQQKILADVMDSLKPGGILIYSTCSYSAQEDEMICDWICKEFKVESVQLKIEESWKIVETETEMYKAFGYRFYPDKLKGEGFFIAAFKNLETQNNIKESKTKNKLLPLGKSETESIKKYIIGAQHYAFVKWQEEILLFPETMQENIWLLQSILYIKKAGVKMGNLIRGQLIPHYEWALSSMASGTVKKLEVDKETALQFLRKKDIDIKTDIKGWAMVSYQQQPLGLVKILPGRVNNYYPKEWRILNK